MGKSYKCASYKGLDISFGREKENLHGGILVRCLQDMDTLEFHEGPCNLINNMFKFFGDISEVKPFIEQNKHFSKENIHRVLDISDLSTLKTDEEANAMNLVELTGSLTGKWARRDVYSSPRVGLTLKKYEPSKEQYFMRDYRFLTNPESIKK